MQQVNLNEHRLSSRESGFLVKAIVAANTAQSAFQLTLSHDVPSIVEAFGCLDPVNSLRTSRGSANTIIVTSLALLDNWFSHTEGVTTILTTHSWENHFAPPHIDCYLLLEFALALFVQTCNVHENALRPHDEDTGCLFDMTADKIAVRWKLRCGYVCGEHKDLYRRYGGQERELAAIEQLLHAARAVAIGRDFEPAAATSNAIADIVVVAALREELQPFKELLTLKPERDPLPYWRAKIGERTVGFVVQSEMGGIESAALATMAGHVLRPKGIMMAGIMGGLSADVALGDVVIAQEVFDYTFGKVVDILNEVDEDIAERYLHDLPHRNIRDDLGRRVNQWITYDQFIAGDGRDAQSRTMCEVHMETTRGSSGLSPMFGRRIHFGRVASGPLVIASQRWKDLIRGLKRKLLGVEMEIFGLMHGAAIVNVPSLAVKGISDLADKDKDRSNTIDQAAIRAFAARASALVIVRLIEAAIV